MEGFVWRHRVTLMRFYRTDEEKERQRPQRAEQTGGGKYGRVGKVIDHPAGCQREGHAPNARPDAPEPGEQRLALEEVRRVAEARQAIGGGRRVDLDRPDREQPEQPP